MSFLDLKLLKQYKTYKNNIVKDFYTPVLKESVLYQRSVGFFSSTALIELTKGITGLVKNNGKMQFIVSPYLSSEDVEAIQKGYEKREIIEKHHLRLPEQYSYAEDFAFGIRYKYYANKMCILEEPLYYYLADSEGSITNSYKRNLLNIIKVLEDMLDFFKKENAFEKYEKELIELSAGFYVRRTREFKNFNDKKLQREFVSEFLKYFKNNFKNYKHQINGFKTKYYRFYRSSYPLMLIYIELQQLRRK